LLLNNNFSCCAFNKFLSDPFSIIQPSFFIGITCATGVPAGIRPSKFKSFNVKGKLTGLVYLSVSTRPSKIVK